MSDLIIGILGISITAAVIIIFLIALVKFLVWLYYDAEARRMRGWLWVLIALVTFLIPGLIIYLILRKPASNFSYRNSKKSQLWKTSLKYFIIAIMVAVIIGGVIAYAQLKM